MTTLHDLYDPPAAPVAHGPRVEPLVWTTGDVVALVGICAALAVASAVAWWAEPVVGLLTALGATLVVVESWFTAVGFLQRHPDPSPAHRVRVILAAILPWAIGLGVAAALMAGLFAVSDRWTWG